MEKEAVIKILSNASMEGDELIEVLSPGKLIINENELIAKYKETEISGMDGTETQVIMGENYVILEREGSTSTKMKFKQGEASVALYNTPYGLLELSIYTKKLVMDINEDGGSILIEYEMKVADQEPMQTKLNLRVEVK